MRSRVTEFYENVGRRRTVRAPADESVQPLVALGFAAQRAQRERALCGAGDRSVVAALLLGHPVRDNDNWQRRRETGWRV